MWMYFFMNSVAKIGSLQRVEWEIEEEPNFRRSFQERTKEERVVREELKTRDPESLAGPLSLRGNAAVRGLYYRGKT